MQAREERSEYAKVLETLEGLLCDGRGGGSGHAGLLVLGMLLPESTVYLPGPLPSAKFVPNSIGGILKPPALRVVVDWGATDAIWLGRLAGIQHIINSDHGFNI